MAAEVRGNVAYFDTARGVACPDARARLPVAHRSRKPQPPISSRPLLFLKSGFWHQFLNENSARKDLRGIWFGGERLIVSVDRFSNSIRVKERLSSSGPA